MNSNNSKNYNHKRIVSNTLALYLRMFIILGIGLFSSRYILLALGVEDYGIMNVLYGVVALFSFITTSMSSATARFLTVSLGKDDLDELKEVFKSSCTIHLIIGVIIIVLAETVGYWLVSQKLTIPPSDRDMTNIVYQITILISFISIIQVPYTAVIIAFERMGIYAIIECMNVILKFGCILLLFKFNSNRLVIYIVSLLIVSVIIFSSYVFISRRSLKGIIFGISFNKKIMSPMLKFSGWDLYGNMSVIARTQGVNVLLNMFFGAILNAASGIASQVQNSVMMLSSNVLMASRPQIVKNFAKGNYTECLNLLSITTKITTVLLLLVCVPIIIYIDYILKIWLVDVPTYTVQFIVWGIISGFIANISSCVMCVIHATGRVIKSSLGTGTLYLLVVPISYFCFRAGCSPVLPYIINTITVLIGLLLNIWYLGTYVSLFSGLKFYFEVVVAFIPIVVLAMLSGLLIKSIIPNNLLGLAVVCLSNLLIVGSSSYLFLLKKFQKQIVKQKILNYVR